MGKPKGKTPSLLAITTGAPVLHTCGRATTCERCEGAVVTGAACFQIPRRKNGFTARPIFCLSCTTVIVAQTKADLARVEKTLQGCV
jgi:hypothetical protein